MVQKYIVGDQAFYYVGHGTAHLTDPDSDSEPDPLSPTTSLALGVADSCDICGYTEDEGIVGIGVGIALPPGDIGWIQCEGCLKWFHLLKSRNRRRSDRR